jgi:hypothetical protein
MVYHLPSPHRFEVDSESDGDWRQEMFGFNAVTGSGARAERTVAAWLRSHRTRLFLRPRPNCLIKLLPTVTCFVVAAVVTLGGVRCTGARAAPDGGEVVTPESSVEKPGDIGKSGHTNVEVFIPHGGTTPTPQAPVPPSRAPATNTPSGSPNTGVGGGQVAPSSERP